MKDTNDEQQITLNTSAINSGLIGVLEKMNIESEKINTENEMDAIFESVFDYAMEAESKKRIISKEVRDALPDSAYGVIYKTKEGEKKKLYPLIVKSDKKATEELIGRALEYFNYCNPLYKKQLAQNIIKAMNETGIIVKIHPKNQINKFVTVPDEYVSTDTKDKYQEDKDKK